MTEITPFWHRLPEFFQYPRHMGALVHILIASVLINIATHIGLFIFPLLFITIPVFLMGVFAILKYSYSVLQHTADGFLTPPDQINSSADMTLVIKQVVAFILMALAVGGMASFFGQAIGIIAGIFLYLWLPASVMIIAVSGSLFNAINPFFFIDFMKRIGWTYLMLWAFLMLLSVASSQSYALLSHVLPEELNLFLFVFLMCYFNIIMFNLLGYVIFQYHDALGYEASQEALSDYKKEQVESDSPTQFDEFDRGVNNDLIAGEYEAAVQKLLIKTKNEPIDHIRQDRLIRLLCSLDAPKLLSEVAERYFLVLLDVGEPKQLSKYLSMISMKLTEYHFESTKMLARLGQIAWDAKIYDAVVNISRSLRKRAPTHPKCLDLGLLEAKVICEFKHKDDDALTLVDELLGQFTHHDKLAELKTYRQFIANLAMAK